MHGLLTSSHAMVPMLVRRAHGTQLDAMFIPQAELGGRHNGAAYHPTLWSRACCSYMVHMMTLCIALLVPMMICTLLPNSRPGLCTKAMGELRWATSSMAWLLVVSAWPRR